MTGQIQYVDLFAGCGGISLGLHQAGFRGLFAIEKSPDAFQTLKFNLIDKHKHFEWPNWLPESNWDITEFIKTEESQLKLLKGKVDLVVGGPPCQGFSVAGQRKEADSRNQLIHSYLHFVALVEPKIIVFENVYGFTLKFSKNGNDDRVAYSHIVIAKLHKLGYTDARGEMIDMSHYGVPQRRKRFIVVATRNGTADNIFMELENGRKEFLAKHNLQERNTVMDALSDLEYRHGTIPSPDTKGFMAGIISESRSSLQYYLRTEITPGYIPDSHRFVNHTGKTVKLFSELLEKANRNKCIVGEARAQYGVKKRFVTVLDPHKRTPTITTIPDDLVHYSEPRVMTVRECARLQTFPDWFEFKGPYTTGGKKRVKSTPRYTQVGNAVPPLFAEQLGLAIKKVLADL